ncbi:hypothetical protein [Acinetobacter pittii]|uniref:hypothetical protein n=1 Tax=Acinetobacter pittii TaxID=48296 RepID=UPI00099355CD|nr:hypothetical protein [Acinetobacter pittii]OOT54474.1 hypothetical protein BTG92_04770 [Acinetobacter pittii]OTU67854.1 hypothetical protein CAT31_09995 [Acinetobacter pittii]
MGVVVSQNYSTEDLNKIIEDLNNQKELAYSLVSEIDKANQFIKNQEAESVYLNAKFVYDQKALKYQRSFYLTLAVTFFLIIFYGTPDFSDAVKITAFILYKLTIFIVGGSLITYFLKLSNFYHLKSEQAYQTCLELQAFPSYVLGLDEKDKSNLRKELASHYFGKNISENMHDKLSNILQEQIKASTDALTSITELYKVSSSTLINNDKATNQSGER